MCTGKPANTTAKEQDLRSRKISDLSLQIKGTWLEPLVNDLYSELENAGVSFKPTTYLSDEWGCPAGVPTIGIPFYLADPELCRMEGQFTGVEAETEGEVRMLLRHEAGHALNYSHIFFKKRGFRKVFGQFNTPYREDYRASPFSARYVRHVPAWYAQKHPDEDFAETFAVWLTPDSRWRDIYKETPAIQKLLYVDQLIRKYGRKPPSVTATKQDKPLQELTMTLDDWYQSCRETGMLKAPLPSIINEDLRRLFRAKDGNPATDLFLANKRQLIRDVNNWTGIDRHILSALFNELLERARMLGLKTAPEDGNMLLVSITAFITTLAMNYQCKGQFVEV